MPDIGAVRRKIAELELTQKEVALACGITQPHLSKILTERVKPGRKASSALDLWLGSETPTTATDQLERIRARIDTAPRRKRMHAMQFLRALESLLEN